MLGGAYSEAPGVRLRDVTSFHARLTTRCSFLCAANALHLMLLTPNVLLYALALGPNALLSPNRS
jgi:hypothetical protein